MAASGLWVLIIGLILPIGLLIGGIFLQFFLCRKEQIWLGLILPGITLLLSLLVTAGLVTFSVIGTTIGPDGVATTAQIAGNGSIYLTAALLFLMCNIPTAILLAIFAVCRGKRRRDAAMEKMRIQDIE